MGIAGLEPRQVDWEKIGSSYACPLAEMMEFFKKAKEYAPKLVSLILPAPTSLTTAPRSSTPSSSTPAINAFVPYAPMDPATKVA
jgi:hypothetical protein